jgi:MarR family transcriptional regulator, 2-MHQ and catechol-resistance regulon repressor
MKKDTSTPVHAWLVMMKAMQAITRYALANLEETGLGLSDFAVLEALHHKGPLPVNVIGPKVNLTPGSISVAIDRLHAKGLVSRVESLEDRRVRIVALTSDGKKLIGPVFREHAKIMEQVFADLSTAELRRLEDCLKRTGKRAEMLYDHQRNSRSRDSRRSM